MCKQYDAQANKAVVELSSIQVAVRAGAQSSLVSVRADNIELHIWDVQTVRRVRDELGELAELNINNCLELAKTAEGLKLLVDDKLLEL